MIRFVLLYLVINCLMSSAMAQSNNDLTLLASLDQNSTRQSPHQLRQNLADYFSSAPFDYSALIDDQLVLKQQTLEQIVLIAIDDLYHLDQLSRSELLINQTRIELNLHFLAEEARTPHDTNNPWSSSNYLEGRPTNIALAKQRMRRLIFSVAVLNKNFSTACDQSKDLRLLMSVSKLIESSSLDDTDSNRFPFSKYVTLSQQCQFDKNLELTTQALKERRSLSHQEIERLHPLSLQKIKNLTEQLARRNN